MESYLGEIHGKQIHDPITLRMMNTRSVFVPFPIIVGAGPSGLAVAACLKEKGISSIVLERSKSIASLWQYKTYDRLSLHLPKEYCQLPLMAFPSEYPAYPAKNQFIDYLDSYAAKFDINPKFNETVSHAEFDDVVGMWRVKTSRKKSGKFDCEETEYVSPWLIAATGENAEASMPEIEGINEFNGEVLHTSVYKNGEDYKGKKVLVVGCGNSGMEVALDLLNHGAIPSIVVRDTVHILPREILGNSTFAVSMWLLKRLPIQTVDKILLLLSRLTIGDTEKYGLRRPCQGPLEMKNVSGKTPVLDVGTFARIKTGEIRVLPGIKRMKGESVEFVSGVRESFDAVIMATGYKSNVPRWMKKNEMFSEENGFPIRPFPDGWRGENGLYAVGFTKRGILGASIDAVKVADDIKHSWNSKFNIKNMLGI